MLPSSTQVRVSFDYIHLEAVKVCLFFKIYWKEKKLVGWLNYKKKIVERPSTWVAASQSGRCICIFAKRNHKIKVQQTRLTVARHFCLPSSDIFCQYSWPCEKRSVIVPIECRAKALKPKIGLTVLGLTVCRNFDIRAGFTHNTRSLV